MQEESESKSAPLVSAGNWEHKIISEEKERHMEIALNGAIAEGWELFSFQAFSQTRNGLPSYELHFSAMLRRRPKRPEESFAHETFEALRKAGRQMFNR